MKSWDELLLSTTCQIPILRHFYEKYLTPESGLFVEVGAYDGYSYSNTSGLADGGWSGVYIEPNPVFANLCRMRHPQENIRVVQCAISDRETELLLDVGGPLTTASRETRKAYAEIDWAKHEPFSTQINVHAYPLEVVLKQLNIPRFFELFVVDVEGFEEQVFASFNLAWWKPKVLIVELNDYHRSFNASPSLQYSSSRVRNLIVANDYMQVYADAINSIFVSKLESKDA